MKVPTIMSRDDIVRACKLNRIDDEAAHPVFLGCTIECDGEILTKRRLHQIMESHQRLKTLGGSTLGFID